MQLAQYEGQQLYTRVQATQFWQRLPDDRKVDAIRKWRTQIPTGKVGENAKRRAGPRRGGKE
jgi:hypothetical protein